MRIIEIETGKILYDSERGEDENIYVSSSFFKALKAGKIQYMTGETIKGISFSEVKTLNLKDSDFDEIFRGIAMSEVGKMVIKEEMPLDTIL